MDDVHHVQFTADQLADVIGPQVAWPSHLHTIADALAKEDPNFNRAKFIERATKSWEQNHDIQRYAEEAWSEAQNVRTYEDSIDF